MRARLLVALSMALVATFSLWAVPSLANAGGYVFVTVSDETTSLPLSSVRVELCEHVGEHWRPYLYGTTNVMGLAQFNWIAEGEYTFRLHDLTGMHAEQIWDRKLTWGAPSSFVLEYGATVQCAATMGPAGHIAGVVTNNLGEPLEGITAYVRCGGTSFMAETRTAADGSYHLDGLAGSEKSIMQFTDFSDVYLYQWYPGAISADGAAPITVRPGETTRVDVQMERAATISGTIATRLDIPVNNICATAYRRIAPGVWEGREARGGSCRPDGTYTIGQLPPGVYRVGFWASDRPGTIKYYGDTFWASDATVVRLGYGEQRTINGVIWGDRIPPTPEAPASEVVVRGGTAGLVYRVRDPRPGGPTADVCIKVRTLGGKTVKEIRMHDRAVNTRLVKKFACDLRRGTYRFFVYAIDDGGNRQTRIAVNSLTVR